MDPVLGHNPASDLEPKVDPREAAFAGQASRAALGLGAEVTYAFSEFEIGGKMLRSAASESIEANCFDGLPDWRACEQVQLIRRDLLVAAPYNPRHYVNREAMATLVSSVGAQGIHTPLEVSRHPEEGKVYVLSGHRRLWVATALDLDLLPCKLDPRGVLTEVQMREALIRYNENQEKPAPVDRARSIFEYLKLSGKTQAQVAALFNISPAGLNQMLRLLTLPTPVQELVNIGKVPVVTALELSRHPGGERVQVEIAERVVREGLTARKVRDLVSQLRGARALGLKSTSAGQRAPAERKSHEFEIEGAHPVKVTVSSTQAVLSPEQIQRALHEVIMQQPVEFEVHHRSAPVHGEHLAPVAPPSTARDAAPTPQTSELVETSATAEPKTLRMAPRLMTPRGLLRSAAADSVGAVFTDGRPDWSRPTVVQLIYRDLLVPHPLNPRKYVSRAAMEETLASIESNGVHTPLHVSQHPENSEKAYLLGGHRRLYCISKLGLDLVPCRLDSRGVLSEIEVREGLVRDNEGQERPAPIDRARSYADYIAASRRSPAAAAERLGLNVQTMLRVMRLLELPHAVQELVNTGQLNESVGLAILEHRGGAEAQTALAYRAVAQRLTAKQVREFVGQSRISLASLVPEKGHSSVTDKVWSVGAGLRIVVHVHSNVAALSAQEIASSLQQAIEQTRRDQGHGSEHSAPALASEKDAVQAAEVRVVKVSELGVKDEAQFCRTLHAYLHKFVVGAETVEGVSPEVAAALRHEVSAGDLKRLELSKVEYSVHSARRWHRLTGLQTPETVSLGQLLEYWGASLEYLRGLPGSKKLLYPREIEAFPLDISCGLGAVPRQRAAGEIRARLESFSETLERKVLTLVDARQLAGAHRRIERLDDPAFEADALRARSVNVHPHLRWYISLWMRNVEGKAPDPQASSDRFTFSELHGYYSYCLKRLLELKGGSVEGLVGAKSLRQNVVAFSANTYTSKASRFGTKAVFEELKRNLETVNLLFQEKQGPFPATETHGS